MPRTRSCTSPRVPSTQSARRSAQRRIALFIVSFGLAGLFGASPAGATVPPQSHGAVVAHNVFALLNSERKAHGLPPLRMNTQLILSAHRHNLTMAAWNTLSHKLPSELSLGGRIIRANYDHNHWRGAGENIGWNSDMSNGGVLFLEQLMYNERPPGDIGHRLNILNSSYRDIGVDVYYDAAHGKVWLTEDFGTPA